jgi:hypothetical protein
LVLALITAGVLISVGVVAFISINNNYRVVHQAASWGEALQSAEAGVEIGLTELRRELTGGKRWEKSNGWEEISPGVYVYSNRHLPLQRGGEGGTKSWMIVSADVAFRDSSGEEWWRIRSHGYCEIPGSRISAGTREDIRLRKLSLKADRYSADTIFNVPSSECPVAHRVVEAIVRPVSAFQMAIFARKQIDLSGNQMVIDSYDSRDDAKSYWPEGATHGEYPWINGDEQQGVDPGKRQWRGDIGTNGTLINAGYADVHGTASTNHGTVLEDSGVHGNFPSDPNRIQNDFFMEVVEVTAPTPDQQPASADYASMLSVSSGAVIQASENSPTVVRLSFIDISAGDTLLIKGAAGKTTDAHLFVSGNISVSDQAGIILEDGVRLRLFVGGDVRISGRGVRNPNPPVNFQLYCLTRSALESENVGNIKIAGDGDFSGAIYAPNYDIEVQGAASPATANLFGGFVGHTVRISGTRGLHYDEAFTNRGIVAGYKIVSWFEDER